MRHRSAASETTTHSQITTSPPLPVVFALALVCLFFTLSRPLLAESAIHVERFGDASLQAVVLIPGLSCGGDV